MTQNGDDDNGIPDLSNRELLKVLMQEIADVRKELKEDIHNLDRKLTLRIDAVDLKLTTRIDNLTLKVDQNQIAFMTNLDTIDKRVAVLERS